MESDMTDESTNEKPPLIPYYFHISRGNLLVIIVVSAFIGAAIRAHVGTHVPGFRYKDGLLFEACYEYPTRAEIGRCLDETYEEAYELGVWD